MKKRKTFHTSTKFREFVLVDSHKSKFYWVFFKVEGE